MRGIVGEGRKGPAFAIAIFLISLVVLALTVFTAAHLLPLAIAAVATAILSVSHRSLLRWRTLLGALILVILFIPIRRYVLPGGLPFQLEPYRLLVALFIAFWVTSLLIDPRVQLRSSGLEGPLFLLVFAALASDALNAGTISTEYLGSSVAKSLTFFVSFLLVFYMVVSVTQRSADITPLLKLLVLGGTVIAVLAVIESRNSYNPFNQLNSVFPFLQPNFSLKTLPIRGARLRAYGPAEHPIALSAALAMLVPFGVYLGRKTRRRGWFVAAGMITIGCLATVSRTGVVMLLAEALVFVWLRPAQMKRLWPALLPALLAVHFALPGAIGSLRASFFPKGGLVQDQRGYRDTGRIGDIGPTFKEISNEPLFGRGFGTRILSGRFINNQLVFPNARILDDQWLATLLETGLVGAFAWIWIFARTIRRIGRAAKQETGDEGWLYVALVASITAYGVGMLTYDAFSFIQVTFLFYIFLGFASALLVPARKRAPALAPVPLPAR